jgi:hypothetical protein
VELVFGIALVAVLVVFGGIGVAVGGIGTLTTTNPVATSWPRRGGCDLCATAGW